MEEGAKNWRKGSKFGRNLDGAQKLELDEKVGRQNMLESIRKGEMMKISDGLWLTSQQLIKM